MNYIKEIDDRGIRVQLKEDNTQICECRISLSNNIWSITEWFTSNEYKNKGYGTQTMKYAVQQLYDAYGMPEGIRYNWNRVNEYVLEWIIRHFDAKPLIPEYERFTGEDTWDSHIYILDKNKFINYFTKD